MSPSATWAFQVIPDGSEGIVPKTIASPRLQGSLLPSPGQREGDSSLQSLFHTRRWQHRGEQDCSEQQRGMHDPEEEPPRAWWGSRWQAGPGLRALYSRGD
jgi:hypothetical protein